MNKIVLLDRNVYIEIEKKLDSRQYNKHRIRYIKKTYNQYETFILPLSTIEGEKSRIETADEKYALFKKENAVLNKFFCKAKTLSPSILQDNLINQEFKDILNDIYPDQIEDLNSVKKFLIEINKKLHNNVSKKDYQNIENFIITTAIENSLPLYNPIVFCTFFVLYKNIKIREIYKFGKNYDNKIYNVLSDFNALKQLAMVKKNFKDKKSSIKVEFLTFDNGLKDLSQYLDIELIEHASDMQYQVKFSHTLFMNSDSNLSEEESSKIFDRIDNIYNSMIQE